MLNSKVRKINVKKGGKDPGSNPRRGPPKGKQPESAKLKSGYELCDL